MKSLVCFLLLACVGATAYGQDFSNKGKDFWVGYGSHVSMYTATGGLNTAGGSQNMVLYFTSDQNANVKVEIPATGWTRTYTVTANTITETEIIPKTGADDARLGTEGISNKGIHITSDKPVVAYAHIYDGSVSGATLLFPTNTLGQDYYILGFTQTSNAAYSYPFCFAIATEDNTVIEITPSANTQTHTAGVAFTVTLQKGQILNLLGQLTGGTGGNQTGVDLTGTRIRSISTGANGCKKIAVYCGTGKINIKCSGSGVSADNFIEQCFPSSAWGKKYITVPTRDMPNNYFRVMVNNASTVVKLNGAPLSGLIAGRYYQFFTNTTNIIEADQPVMVAQFISTANNCGNTVLGGNGDPEIIYLSPVEQTINKITLNSTPHAVIDPKYHYINVVMKTAGVSSFKLDNVNIASSFLPLPGDASYSYVQWKTTAGIHNLESDSGFNAIAYGFGSAESYGYNAGTNVIDLYQFVTLQNQYATVNFPATCKNAPFHYSITLPYQATSLNWDFNSNPNLSPNTTVVNSSPVPDSTFVRDGKTLYTYTLPLTYTFAAIGTYPVKVTANNPTPDGCSGTQEISYDVMVYDPPSVDFSIANSGCLPDTVKFADITSSINARPNVKWKWDFGDNTVDSVKSPLKKYTTFGTYNIKMQAITDVGCIADTTKTISINPQPVAKFGVTGLQCANSVITYSDSSTVAQGSIAKWVWNFGNGIIITSTTNALQTQTYAAGTYTVTLQVESAAGCKSIVFSRQVVIHDNPVVKFSLPVVCLPAGAAQFNDSSTIADGTAASFIYQWQFGDGGTATIKNPVHNYTTAGPFAVKLMITSTYGCMHDTTEQLATVYPQAKAAFNVLPEVCLRDTTSYIDQSTGSGSNIVAWKWDFGDNKTDTTQSPKHRYASPGTYQTKLFVITDKGCVSDTALHAVVVNPLPVADFSTSNPLCETKDITITDKSAANAGTLANWFWNFGDGTTATYSNANAFTKKYDSAATYNLQLAVKTNKGCKSDTVSKLINIHAMPVANFIMPQVCLSDAFANFKDSSYIKDGTGGSFTYLWNFADANANAANPNTSSQKNPVHTYSATGLYNVSLAVTSTNGCVANAVKQFTVNGSVPKADFNVLNSASLCSNIAVQIQNASAVNFGSITKVEIVWDVAGAPATIVTDSLPTPNKIYTHAYAALQATKTYQVKFRAYSGISCVDEKIKSITVNASPKTSFTTMPGICFDANARQITQASGGGVTGTEMFSGAGVSSSGLFTPPVAGVGTHTIHYVYTSDKGCKDSIDKPITVWPSPTAAWGYTSPTCINNSITITDSSLANYSNIIQWNWNFGDGTNATYTNKNPFAKKYTATGLFTATLQVKTDSGCISTLSSKTINIHPLPKVDFSLPSVCLPDGQAKFTNLSTIADATESSFTYLWNFGDANNTATSQQKDGLHKYTTTGPFNVQLIVTSGNGCVDSATKAFTTIYPQPKADFTVSPTDSCLGGTFYFTDLSKSTTSNITNWNWNFGDGTKSTLQNPSRQYTSARTFNITLSIVNAQGCVSDTATKSVIVYPYPTVNAGADLFVLEGGNVVINASAGGNNLLYRWTPSTYLNNDTTLKPITTPADDITYRLTVTSQGGCKNFDEVFIKVLKSPTIPNVFSPNGDGVNDVWLIKYLESYPGNTVQIFNRYGQLVFNSKGYSKPWDGTMNGSPLPVGVYYYIIDPKNGRKAYTGSVTILR